MRNFKVGEWVKVARDNDNDCYDNFRNKRLQIVSAAHNTEEHPGYDDAMKGMSLYDLKDEEGNYIPCSLYTYELEKA